MAFGSQEVAIWCPGSHVHVTKAGMTVSYKLIHSSIVGWASIPPQASTYYLARSYSTWNFAHEMQKHLTK